ncbi:hypothetical protein AB6F65_10140 [Providencia hangzhouensis]|uniref:hypothetical protein n=1 Tax=Providencia hangzhouensis TaxID=3031799 RepID=UPI0034DD2F73
MIQEKFAYIIPLEEIYVPSDGIERRVKPLVTLKVDGVLSMPVNFKFMVVLTGVKLSKEYRLLISVKDITDKEQIILINTGTLKHFETEENSLGFCTLTNQIQLDTILIHGPSSYRVDFKLFDDEGLSNELDSYHVLLNAEVGE